MSGVDQNKELRFAVHHLAEAISELTNLLILHASSETLDPEAGAAFLAHAQQHLNWYWAGRVHQDFYSDGWSEEQWNEYARFSEDLYEHMAGDPVD